MTTIAKLLGLKQQLLERLQENPSSHERDETARLLMRIETALDLVEEAGPALTERIGRVPSLAALADEGARAGTLPYGGRWKAMQ